MAQQIINNLETGAVVRGKINDNFTEVYGIADMLSGGFSATSVTSNTIGTGLKTFTVEIDKQFTEGQFVIAVNALDITDWMIGQVTTYVPSTGVLTFDSETTSGSGTFNDWLISISGPSGVLGVFDINSGTTGTLGVGRGGSGGTTFTSGRLIRGNGTSAFTPGGIDDQSNALAVTIDSNERVGIGTASPSEVLHVNGNIRDDKGQVRRLIKSGETSGTLTVASANEWVRATAGVTIPASVFSENDTVMIVNKSGGSITITQGGGLTLTNTSGATGNRTLANHGIVTVLFNSASDAYIFGAGLS